MAKPRPRPAAAAADDDDFDFDYSPPTVYDFDRFGRALRRMRQLRAALAGLNRRGRTW